MYLSLIVLHATEENYQWLTNGSTHNLNVHVSVSGLAESLIDARNLRPV